MNGAGTLMLVQTQFEVHAHQGKIVPIIINRGSKSEKNYPAMLKDKSKGESPFVGSLSRQKASGLRKISLGPTNPAMARFMLMMATSLERAAEAPLESLSCLPARMAR